MMLRTSALALAASAATLVAFPVEWGEQPVGHPRLTPADGATVAVNPPGLIWRVDPTAASYILELAQDPAFGAGTVRVEGIDLPFYNHREVLAPGTWHWRYRVVRADATVSDPSPVQRFVVPPDAVPLPVPPTREILARLPAHPRVFVTPHTLAEFRARREGPAAEAWDEIRHAAEQALALRPEPVTLLPFPAEPGTSRQQVFFLEGGEPRVPEGIRSSHLNAAAGRANVLSWAYLVSGDERYALAAREWLLWLLPFRMDYHLDRKARAAHDTVVYNYEYGLKHVALAYDRIHDFLDPAQRADVLAHVQYHGDNAYRWCRDGLRLDLRYENSHGQQCMHALVVTTMAVMGDLPEADAWADWLVRQYANRLAWGGDDGGYSEGQTYGHKFGMILEALAAIRTATGVDLFRKPRLRHAGEFWLYCMALNYWWNHWGDVYHLLNPMQGSGADGAIAGLLASMTDNRTVKWYSDTVVTPPAHIPFRYLSEAGLQPKPPVDIAQARLFPEVGQLAAYDRFYDHGGDRIFFRSSPWGSHSHAHCDQNGFVLHAGGEIMACDAGYYTYYGDTYHREFSMASVAHNTLLVDGQGQPKSIEAKGLVSSFFDSPRYCVFTGSAATAYPGLLDRFERTVLYLRPGVWVVHDDVAAPKPSAYTWLLNTFTAAEIDAAAASMTVRQRDQRLSVRHLFPAGLTYAQSNERPAPMLTKRFCRYTEAFPQPFTIRVTTPPRASEQILAVLHVHPTAAEPMRNGQVRGLRLTDGSHRETILFRPVAATGESSADSIAFAARATAVGTDDGRLQTWLVQRGTRLRDGDRTLLAADVPVDASAHYAPPAAAAQFWIGHEGPARIRLHLPARPRTVWAAPAHQPEKGRMLAVAWADGVASVELAGQGATVLWVDPVRDLASPPPTLAGVLQAGPDRHELPFETAVADNGEIVAFAMVTPAVPGVYRLTAPGAELLVQDRWDPDRSVRGTGSVRAPWREGTEIFVRFRPHDVPAVRAELEEATEWVDVLRNGSFEAGIPGYPPRGWTIRHPRQMGLSWPHWSQEDASDGTSALKFVRPEIRMTLAAQPMRLLVGGTYRLRFLAKGNATTATATVAGARGTKASIKVEPSEQWREYETELEMRPGYTTLVIDFGPGGEPDQTLWVDAVSFSRKVGAP